MAIFEYATTAELEKLVSDLYDHASSIELPATVQLIKKIEHELVERDLDLLAKQDLDEMLGY